VWRARARKGSWSMLKGQRKACSVQEGTSVAHTLSNVRNTEATSFQRFVLVIEGDVTITSSDGSTIALAQNDFAFFPSSMSYTMSYTMLATRKTGLLVYERPLREPLATALSGQEILSGNVDSRPLLDTGAISRHACRRQCALVPCARRSFL
jgi:hypothetical protein